MAHRPRYNYTECNEGSNQHAGIYSAQSIAELADSTAEELSQGTQGQFIGVPPGPPPPPPRHHAWRMFGLGAVFAIVLQVMISWLSVAPVWERFFGRFVWNRGKQKPAADPPPAFEASSESTALVLYSDSAESVEWVNMCWRKVTTCSHTYSFQPYSSTFAGLHPQRSGLQPTHSFTNCQCSQTLVT